MIVKDSIEQRSFHPTTSWSPETGVIYEGKVRVGGQVEYLPEEEGIVQKGTKVFRETDSVLWWKGVSIPVYIRIQGVVEDVKIFRYFKENQWNSLGPDADGYNYTRPEITIKWEVEQEFDSFTLVDPLTRSRGLVVTKKQFSKMKNLKFFRQGNSEEDLEKAGLSAALLKRAARTIVTV